MACQRCTRCNRVFSHSEEGALCPVEGCPRADVSFLSGGDA